MEHGLNANHLMITDYTRDLKVDGKSMKDIVFTFNEQINFLQSQMYDLQNQVFEYEARFKGMSLAASCRTRETHSSSYDGEPLPWKPEDKIATTSSPPPPFITKGNLSIGYGHSPWLVPSLGEVPRYRITSTIFYLYLS